MLENFLYHKYELESTWHNYADPGRNLMEAVLLKFPHKEESCVHDVPSQKLNQ